MKRGSGRGLVVPMFGVCCLALGAGAGADDAPSPSPSPSGSSMPSASGPCAAAALPSIAVRPGLGRAPATGGAVCVAPPGGLIVGVGYRAQATTGVGRQELTVYPDPVLLIGVGAASELILSPGLIVSRRTGVDGGLPPVNGQQDAGFGIQHVLDDRPWAQQALALFVTLPTGFPAGPAGFSAGAPAYTLSYNLAFPLGPRFGLSTSQGLLLSSGRNPSGAQHRYAGYQESVNFSYSVSPSTILLLEDQITAPTAPRGPTGNRALLGVQRSLSPNLVLDAEYELNLLPAPGFRQHAFGAGLTFRP